MLLSIRNVVGQAGRCPGMLAVFYERGMLVVVVGMLITGRCRDNFRIISFPKSALLTFVTFQSLPIPPVLQTSSKGLKSQS